MTTSIGKIGFNETIFSDFVSYDTHSIIESAYINIHNDPERKVGDIIENINDEFGILYIKVAKTDIIKTPLHLLFTIDITKSMYGSKFNSLKNTMLNIIDYLAEKSENLEIYITIHTFNSSVDVLLDNTKITNENKHFIQQTIKKIVVSGCTDIGCALNAAAECLYQYKQINPNHKIGHIFMTDGQPTTGITDHTTLSSFIDECYMNIIIGFGEDHNAKLLLKMCEDSRNTEYHFIENFKNTGFVYGEIIHKFLYPAIENITIRVDYGLIYDWRNNNWVKSIQDNIFISDVEKTYHIRTEYPNMVNAKLYGNAYSIVNNNDKYTELLDIILPLPSLMDKTGENILFEDLSNYIFRQRVQELLYQAITLVGNNIIDIYNFDFEPYKNEINLFFKKIRKYMRETNLLEDPFMINLCDDIKVIYSKLNSKSSIMYLSARQSSQGRQQSYTVNIEENDDNRDSDDNLLLKLKIPKINYLSDSNYDDHDDTFDNLIDDDEGSHHQINKTFKDSNNIINIEDALKQLDSDDDDYELIKPKIIKEDDDDIKKYKSSMRNTSCYHTKTILETMNKINKK